MPLSGHDTVALLSDVAKDMNDAEYDTKIDRYVIFASLRSDST